MQKILVIQTAFIGDVVLATALIEKLHNYYPEAEIDFLLRKGNEALLENHPFLHEVLIWDKKSGKKKNLIKLLFNIRRKRYDAIINLQRFFATGLLTAFSKSPLKIGFEKNPLSFLFHKKLPHLIEEGIHEVDRNQKLIADLTDEFACRPKLYPSAKDEEKIKDFTASPFITITPSSVWFTKQYPVEKWIEFIKLIPSKYQIFLLGASGNFEECNLIKNACNSSNISILAGRLSFLQSTLLMKYAIMNFVNDSAPLHFASAINAPVTAIFCSTVPEFGFTPLSDNAFIVQTLEHLACKPCGLHGRKTCPMHHFKCAYTIAPDQLLKCIPS